MLIILVFSHIYVSSTKILPTTLFDQGMLRILKSLKLRLANETFGFIVLFNLAQEFHLGLMYLKNKEYPRKVGFWPKIVDTPQRRVRDVFSCTGARGKTLVNVQDSTTFW